MERRRQIIVVNVFVECWVLWPNGGLAWTSVQIYWVLLNIRWTGLFKHMSLISFLDHLSHESRFLIDFHLNVVFHYFHHVFLPELVIFSLPLAVVLIGGISSSGWVDSEFRSIMFLEELYVSELLNHNVQWFPFKGFNAELMSDDLFAGDAQQQIYLSWQELYWLLMLLWPLKTLGLRHKRLLLTAENLKSISDLLRSFSRDVSFVQLPIILNLLIFLHQDRVKLGWPFNPRLSYIL